MDAEFGVELTFDDDGLVPVIAQSARDETVLMLAYATKEAIERTLKTGYAHYYSRSRDELWEKGTTSGHRQRIVDVLVDCDADTILYRVHQVGGACHTGYRSCFYRDVAGQPVGEQVFDPDDVYD